MANRQSLYITEQRVRARNIFNGITELLAAQVEYNALDYGNTLPDGELENEGVTRVEVGAVVFDTANALKTLLDSGHATNLAKLL